MDIHELPCSVIYEQHSCELTLINVVIFFCRKSHNCDEIGWNMMWYFTYCGQWTESCHNAIDSYEYKVTCALICNLFNWPNLLWLTARGLTVKHTAGKKPLWLLHTVFILIDTIGRSKNKPNNFKLHVYAFANRRQLGIYTTWYACKKYNYRVTFLMVYFH